MLRPTKHSHPDRTVINVALVLLTRLRVRRLAEFDELRDFARKEVTGGAVLFLAAVNLLYLFGLIEYRPKTDAFEYVGPDEVI